MKNKIAVREEYEQALSKEDEDGLNNVILNYMNGLNNKIFACEEGISNCFICVGKDRCRNYRYK